MSRTTCTEKKHAKMFTNKNQTKWLNDISYVFLSKSFKPIANGVSLINNNSITIDICWVILQMLQKPCTLPFFSVKCNQTLNVHKYTVRPLTGKVKRLTTHKFIYEFPLESHTVSSVSTVSWLQSSSIISRHSSSKLIVADTP